MHDWGVHPTVQPVIPKVHCFTGLCISTLPFFPPPPIFQNSPDFTKTKKKKTNTMCPTPTAPILNTQKELRNFGLKAVIEGNKLKHRRHPCHPSLVQLHYTGNSTRKEVQQECRGLILNEADNWAVVAYPYKKFFNHRERPAASIDWNTAKVYPKLDGSMMTMYHFAGEWHIASSSMPDASGHVGGGFKTFRNLFWAVFKKIGYSLPPAEYHGHSFVFEMMTAQNKIICEVQENIVLHGARRLGDHAEEDHRDLAEKLGWQATQHIEDISSLAECLAAAGRLDPLREEGFVIADASFNRIKIKSPAYVAIANTATRARHTGDILAMVTLKDESAEYTAYFPEHTDTLKTMDSALKTMKTLYTPLLALLCDDTVPIPLPRNDIKRLRTVFAKTLLCVEEVQCYADTLYPLEFLVNGAKKEKEKEQKAATLREVLAKMKHAEVFDLMAFFEPGLVEAVSNEAEKKKKETITTSLEGKQDAKQTDEKVEILLKEEKEKEEKNHDNNTKEEAQKEIPEKVVIMPTPCQEKVPRAQRRRGQRKTCAGKHSAGGMYAALGK